MHDQKRRFDEAGIGCEVLKGGQTKEERRNLFRNLREGKSKVLITNAECLGQTPLLHKVARIRFSLAVIDEAHTMVQWGSTFRPSYARLGMLVAHLGIPCRLAFTATASTSIKTHLQKMLFLGHKPKVIEAPTDRKGIIYHSEATFSYIHTILRILDCPQSHPAIVFSPTRKKSELMANLILKRREGWDVRFYHAGMEKQKRKEVESWFQSSQDGVLVSTCAFGLGVDKKNIRTIIHTYLPSDVESYLQESGRAGRDGKKSDAWMLYTRAPRGELGACFTKYGCIRKKLMRLMGQEIVSCAGCDTCMKRIFLLREGEKEILGRVKSRPFLFDGKTLIRDLKEGVLPSWEKEDITFAIRILINEKKLSSLLGRIYPKFSFAWGKGTCHTFPLEGSHDERAGSQGGIPSKSISFALWKRNRQ